MVVSYIYCQRNAFRPRMELWFTKFMSCFSCLTLAFLYARFDKNYGTALSVRPSVRKQFLYAPLLSNRYRYLHAVLYEYLLGQDNVSQTRIIAPKFLVSELCPFDFYKHSCTLHNSVPV